MFSSNSSQVSSAVSYIEDVFSTYLYTGNSANQSIVNGIDLSTYGGLVWVKNRQDTTYHNLFDTNRGIYKRLYSSTTNAQVTNTEYLTAFNSNGFDTGTGLSDTFNYVSWTFRKQPKFFDVVTWTGDGNSSRVIPHNLQARAAWIFVKKTSGTGDWLTFNLKSDGTGFSGFLNTTAGGNVYGYSFGTATTVNNATDIPVGFLSSGFGYDTNINNATYVAYVWASNAGGFGLTGTDNVISCGSFTTDGNGTIPETTLGYEPQYVMFKASSTTGAWTINDTMRGQPTPVSANASAPDATLYANNATAESQADNLYPTATGFKGVYAAVVPSTTYIYIAIRRGPMKVPTLGTSVFDPISRAGTGANATITTSLSPVDMVLETPRSPTIGTGPNIFDRLRGANAILITSSTAIEGTPANTLTGFDVQAGYTVGSDSSGYGINYASGGFTYINWNFRRAPSFFDEVCYTGTGGLITVNHNLGVVPEMVIGKSRTATSFANSNRWLVYCAYLPGSPITNQYIVLNSTAASVTNTNVWGNTPLTSTTVTIGGIGTMDAGITDVLYLFATCPGVSKVGSYTGNGTTQTIDCGFGAGGARFVLIKRTDDVGGWYVYDTARGMTVLTDPYLQLNSTAAEVATLGSVTTVSTGFAVNNAILAGINAASPAAYIFLAIA